MKKMFVLVVVAIFIIAVLAFAAEEIRPSQRVMQARLGWITAMMENLGAKKFEVVADAAGNLALQTYKIGEGLPNSLAKNLTLDISLLAMDVSGAAAKQDGETVKAKMGEIKGKCDECHVKIRDKK